MCRFSFYGPYKDHWVCFACRKVFRKPYQGEPYPDSPFVRRAASELARPQEAPITFSCPDCQGVMYDLGHGFKAPRRNDLAQWRKVRLLFEAGITFHSCGCDAGGVKARTLLEARDFVAQRRLSPRSEGARLLQKIEAQAQARGAKQR